MHIKKIFSSSQYALHVYDHLVSVGADFDLRLAGAYAMDSLRMEKAFRHWGHELDTETTPWEARLGFAVDMKKVVAWSDDVTILSASQTIFHWICFLLMLFFFFFPG